MSEDKEKPPARSPVQNAIAGGLSAMFATAVTSPLDVVKIRRQMFGELKMTKRNSTLSTFKLVYKQEGVPGFYRGLPAALFRQSIYSTARFGLFAFIGEKVPNPTENIFISIGIGMAAGAGGALLSSPADLVMLRMQSDGRLPMEARRNYKNPFEAIYRITTRDGLFSLWQGAGPNINRAMVVTAAQLVTYKRVLNYVHTNEYMPLKHMPTVSQLISSLTAGFVTAVAASPADVIRARIMNAGVMQRLAVYAPGSVDCYGYTPKVVTYSGTVDCVKKIVKTEGFAGLYKGFWAYYARVGPYVMTLLMVNEQVKKYI